MVFVTSCIYTEEMMPETTVYLQLDESQNCEEFEVDVMNGEVVNFGDCRFRVTYFRSRGGRTILLGKVLKDKSAENTNLLSFKKKDQILRKYSYNQLSDMSVKTVSDTSYVFIEMTN